VITVEVAVPNRGTAHPIGVEINKVCPIDVVNVAAASGICCRLLFVPKSVLVLVNQIVLGQYTA